MAETTSRRAACASLLSLLTGPAAAAGFVWEPVTIPADPKVEFVDRGGKPLTLRAFRERPLLLNIWATWCAPCVIELPALDRLQRDAGGAMTVLALSVDRRGLPAVLNAYKRLRIRRLQPYVDESGAAISELKVVGLPVSLAVSRDGGFLAMRRGRVDWDAPEERTALRTMLGY